MHHILKWLDPQVGLPPAAVYPAASILAALQKDNPKRDDHTLILGNVAAKAMPEVCATVLRLLHGHLAED